MRSDFHRYCTGSVGVECYGLWVSVKLENSVKVCFGTLNLISIDPLCTSRRDDDKELFTIPTTIVKRGVFLIVFSSNVYINNELHLPG